MRIEVAGTGHPGIDWEDEAQPLEPLNHHPCCGSPERCWACSDNEDLARILARAMAPLTALTVPRPSPDPEVLAAIVLCGVMDPGGPIAPAALLVVDWLEAVVERLEGEGSW